MSTEAEIFEDFLRFCGEEDIVIQPNNQLKEVTVLSVFEDQFAEQALIDVALFKQQERINRK